MVCTTLLDNATNANYPYDYLLACAPYYGLIHGQSDVSSAITYTKFINLIESIGSPDVVVLPSGVLNRFNVSLYKPVMGSPIYEALVNKMTFHTPEGDVAINMITDIDAYIDVVNSIRMINELLTNAGDLISIVKDVYDAVKGSGSPDAGKELRVLKPVLNPKWIDIVDKYKSFVKFSSEKINAASRERTIKELSKLNLSKEAIESRANVGEVSFSVSDFTIVDSFIVVNKNMLLINASDAEIFNLLLGEFVSTQGTLTTNVFTNRVVIDMITLGASMISRVLDREFNVLLAVKPDNIDLFNHLIAAVMRLLPCLFMDPAVAIKRLSNVNCGDGFASMLNSVLGRVRQLLSEGKYDEAYNYINKAISEF